MFRSALLVILALLPALFHGQTLRRQTCSRDNSATIQPDAAAWLGGIISLNGKGAGDIGCGMPAGSMQSYEAMRWVLDLLNKKDEFLQTEFLTDYYVPGIPLGMKVRNYCDNEMVAASSVYSIFPELSGDDEACTAQTSNLTVGIIGGSTSDASMAISDATSGYDIPLVSYESTASQLTMPGMYENFMRTISPDGPLMEVIARVLKELQWNYVVIVYDSGSYGRTAYNELHAVLVANDICLTAAFMINDDEPSTASATLDRVRSTEAVGVIYFGSVTYAKALIEAGNGMLPEAGELQWMFVDFPVDSVFEASSVYQRGIITVTVASRFIVEFEDHWIRIDEANPSSENPWFSDWYENQYNCKFNPTQVGERDCDNLYPTDATQKELQKRSEYQQDQYVESAVMAVYTYARALRTAQTTLCGPTPGVCQALASMTREEFYNNFLKQVNFTFTADERVPSLASRNVAPYNAAKHLSFTPYGDIRDPSYYIYNYNNIETGGGANTFKFRRVGSYINGYLDLNLGNVGMYNVSRQVRLVPPPPSPCPAMGCMPCLGLPADTKYYFEQGDIVIHGVFSLHNMGITPLTCGGKMSDNQYMFLEAMIYAIRLVNNNAILNNLKLGGLGNDDCSSPTLGLAFLTQVLRGNLEIMDQSGNTLDPRSIEAYTAAHTTMLTLPLAEAMNMLMRPMVGYRAGGSELDDKNRYPYYLRAKPGIHDEIRAIILLLKRLDWMYVQVVTSDMYYSQDAEKVFREMGAREGICIVATHHIGTSTMDAERTVISLAANKATPPTIVLLETHDIRRLLQAYDSVNNTDARRHVVLIGTTTWGTDTMITQGIEYIAQGAMTLSLQRSPLDTFSNYLRTLDVSTYTLNPWFKDWYMAVHACSIDGQGTGPACDMTRPITDGINFRLLYEVEGVINAVRAISQGLHTTLQYFCGNNYNSVCTGFLNAADKGQVFLEEIKQVAFVIENTLPNRLFTFEGDTPAIPFVINSYDNGNYREVGDVTPWNSVLSITLDRVAVYPGVSLNTISPTCLPPCLECLYMSNYFDYWYIHGDVVIGGIFDIHYAGQNGPFSCGAVRGKNGGLYTEVFNFALQHINGGRASVRLRNVTLGGLAFDGCTNPPRATAIVNRVHTGMDIMDSQGNQFMTSQLISWMSYDSQTTIDTASLLQKLGMPLVSPGATAPALDDKNKFYTFFRTIPSDTIIAHGMADFVNEMGWRYVIVLNAPDTSSRQSRDVFRERLADAGICVVANFEFITDGNMEVIMRNILDFDTDIVAVFSEPDQYIGGLLRAWNDLTEPLRIIANRPWGIQTSTYPALLADSVYFDLPNPSIPEFIAYLNTRNGTNMDNPWFQEIYQDIFGCNLPGTYDFSRDCNVATTLPLSGNYEQDIWTLSTINAVYALAKGIDETLKIKCGPSYSGLCPNFMYDEDVRQELMTRMDANNFTDIVDELFRFIEREAASGFRLHRYTQAPQFEREGTLNMDGVLTLTNKNQLVPRYQSVRSECLGDCLVCSVSDANLQDFTLVTGNIYIVGLFDVHKQGASPFTCGPINDKHGLPLLEAFHYALELVNNKTGIFSNILPGVQLGGIGLDMCQSPSRAANLVANIHSGNLQLEKDGIIVSPRRIDAYVATMDTESSIRVADILTQLAMPQISYGATGIDLLNTDKYSFFLRSVPADDKQARAIVSYLKKFEYNNIQVVSSFDEIGDPGMKEFKRLAQVNRICVKVTHVVGEYGNLVEDSRQAVTNISANPTAEVVILWMKDPLPLLEEVNKNPTVYNNFLFIATDKWGADPEYLKLTDRIGNLLTRRNLVILDVETADITGYDRFLENKTPDNYKINPWFKEYFEMDQNCYWDDNNRGSYTRACDKSSTIPRSDHYIQDPYVLYVVNAVFSAAFGIHRALERLCVTSTRPSFFGVCNRYATSGERRQNVLAGLKEIEFVDDTHQPFFFTEDGQSDRGFHIYNITSDNSGNFHYMNVGSYNDSHFLKLDITYQSLFNARCDAEGTDPQLQDCVCPFPPDLPSRFMKRHLGNRGLTLVYVGDIHQMDPMNPLGCGPINTGVDLQRLLAFFFAIEVVNSDPRFENDLKFDGLALDSCSHSLRLGQDVYNILSGNRLCDSDEDGLVVSPSSIAAFVVDKDSNAIPMASMLSRKRITTISPTAGSTMLNDDFIYPYFLRTRGDNSQTAQVILEIAEGAGWNHMSVVFTDNLSQRGAKDAFLDRAANRGACVATALSLSMDATLEDAQDVLEKLSQQVGARAVVLFVEPAHFKLLLQASQSRGLTGRFIWLVTSEWAHDGSNVAGYEQEAAGSIMIEARSAILQRFTEYVTSLTLTNRRGIPDDWFREIYETLHQCDILNLENPSTDYTRICTGDERITASMVSQDPSVLHVILSVLAVADGLNTACKNERLDVAACLQIALDRRDIFDAIQGVNLRVPRDLLPSGQTFEFSFDTEGNGQSGYIIKNYRLGGGQLSSYEQYVIGDYSPQGLQLNLDNYAGGNLYSLGDLPSSNCAPGTDCTCQLSNGNTWTFSSARFSSDAEIVVGGIYRDPKTLVSVQVNSIPQTGDRFDEAWAIILTVLAIIGAVVSIIIFIYLLVMYPVRGGTSILGFILCFGIILLYLMVFPFIAHADDRICGLRRFGLGFVYAIVYSALLVKLIDCWRVGTKDGKYSKLGRPFGFFMVTVFLVLVQVMINAEWLILREPTYERIFYDNAHWPRCSPEDFYDEALVLSLVYIMAIIAFSLFLGLATFSVAKNHHESRWILGILIVSVPCWVIWCAVSILAAIEVRDAAVAVGLLVNATAMLLLVPIRKLYLLYRYSILLDEEEEEDEKQSTIALSQRGNDYSSVYGRQYDNNPRLHDTGSNVGGPNEYSTARDESAVAY